MTEIKPTNQRRSSDSRSLAWAIWGPTLLLLVLGFVAAYQFVGPAPPDHVILATGPEGGAYHSFGKRYREILARQGIDLELRSTAGSLENLELLRDDTSAVQVALVQSGTADSESAEPKLSALASLYYEPLWFFYRGASTPEMLHDLRGWQLAIGSEGSGTRSVVSRLFVANGLDPTAGYRALGGEAGASALRAGEVQGAFFVSSARSAVIQELLRDSNISVFHCSRALGYTRVFRFLSAVVLPQGAVDFQENLPDRDVTLVAPTAGLVARSEIHPAIVDLLLQAATEVHTSGGLFEEAGAFPSPHGTDYPVSPEARRYFRYGPPFLQRYLPFWAASFVDRMKVMLLPLLTLLIPLFKIVPLIYRWRVRGRVIRWYRDLIDIDLALDQDPQRTRAESHQRELDRIEGEVEQVTVPLSYADELYHLRTHVQFVRDKLERVGSGRPEEGPSDGA